MASDLKPEISLPVQNPGQAIQNQARLIGQFV
jgi:hypothetical protein